MKKNTPKKQPRKLSSPIAGAYIEGSGIVEQKDIVSTLEENYMPYAMSVIVSRALPEIDGHLTASCSIRCTRWVC